MKKQIISEEFKRMRKLAGLINENQLNEAEDLLSMLRDYISADYTADQATSMEDSKKAEEDKKRIEAEITKLKGKSYFDALDFFASQNTYDQEYAGAEESDEIQPQLEELAKKLGFTVDQLKGI